MVVDFKCLNVDVDPTIKEEIIKKLNNDKYKQYINNVTATIYQRPNSRRIIDLKIKTNNEDEYLYISGNAFDFQYTLKDLEQNLNKAMKKYNPKKYIKRKELEKKWAEERIRNHERNLKKIEEAKKAKEAEEARVKKAKEEKRLAEVKAKNETIQKLFEKKQKNDLKLEKEIQEELDAHKKAILEEQKEQEERLQEVSESISNVNIKLEKDLQEDEKVQSEIKASKEKLRQMWAEENECLLIIDKIKQWNSKTFSSTKYKINEPFELVPGRQIYHDGQDNYFIAENGEWVPFYDIDKEFEVFKANKLQELEMQLIAARAKRKKHLSDVVDDANLIEKLKESKQILKEKEIEQKKQLKQLSKDKELVNELFKNDMKTKAIDLVDKIHVAETHAPNEQFEVQPGIFAYHDGEGNYFVFNPKINEWIPSTKDQVYYNNNNLLNLNLVEEHEPNKEFVNDNGVTFYHDGLGNYFELFDGNWVQSTYEKCYPKKAKLIKKHNQKNKKDIILDKNESYTNTIRKQQEKIYLEKSKKTTALNDFDLNVIDDQVNKYQSDTSNQDNNTTTTSGQAQQWQDESTGVWWYLDEQGNYYYADEQGNWIPYQQN